MYKLCCLIKPLVICPKHNKGVCKDHWAELDRRLEVPAIHSIVLGPELPGCYLKWTLYE